MTIPSLKLTNSPLSSDEGHRLKSTQIKTSQVLQTLSTSRRIILSGTPLQNDLSEFFAMIDFVQPGRLGPYKTFKRIFEDAILAGSQSDASEDVKEIAKKRFEELKIVTDAFVLRRTKEINEKYLPPKRISTPPLNTSPPPPTHYPSLFPLYLHNRRRDYLCNSLAPPTKNLQINPIVHS